jgi:hypothetical protein
MGMFDEITVKTDLPLNDELMKLNINWSSSVFQTKDLDNSLDHYEISADGELIKIIIEYEYVPYTKEEQKKVGSWNLWKDVKEKSRRTEKVDFHGKINFYELLDLSEKEQAWVEFEAFFVYGKLDKIVLYKIEKVESYKLKAKEIEQEFEAIKKTFPYRTKKLLRKLGWSHFWRSVIWSSDKVQSLFSRINRFIYRYIM